MTSIKLIKYPINVEHIVQQTFDCLNHYEWEYSEDVVRQIVNDTLTNKANVIDALSTDPDWDWSKLAIHKKSNYEQGVDKDTLENCIIWVRYNYANVPSLNKMEKDPDPLRSYESICKSKNMFETLKFMFDDIVRRFGKTEAHKVTIFGNTYETTAVRYNKLKEIASKKYSFETKQITEECQDRIFLLDLLLNVIRETATSTEFVTGDYKGKWYPERTERFNEYAKKLGVKTTAKVGQKYSKPILALLKELGFDKIDGYKSNSYTSWGWNQFTAKLGDAVSPQSYTRHTLLSVHPVDFLRMSMGNSWQSCHTIDKLGVDGRGGDAYEGQYCAGTISYMRDSTSFVYYTAKSDLSDDTDFCFEDKYTREMFHIGTKDNPFFIQGRVYPQSNDYGADSLYAQYRQNVEAILSKAWDIDNQWKVAPSRNNSDCFWSEGLHYRDYINYDVCKLVYSQSVDKADLNPITIGSESICIECGYEGYTNTESISCCSTLNRTVCECCGRNISRYEECYNANTGDYFCGYCASYCEYCNTYHHNNDFRYETVNGNYLCDREIEGSDYWVYSDDACAYAPYEDTYYCDYNGFYYYELDNAREDGYYWYNDSFYTEQDLYNEGLSEEEVEEIVA